MVLYICMPIIPSFFFSSPHSSSQYTCHLQFIYFYRFWIFFDSLVDLFLKLFIYLFIY